MLLTSTFWNMLDHISGKKKQPPYGIYRNLKALEDPTSDILSPTLCPRRASFR